MAAIIVSLPIPSPQNSSRKKHFLQTTFLPPNPLPHKTLTKTTLQKKIPTSISSITSSSSSSSTIKIIRNPSLDRHVLKQNKLRFVQKLKTLLLSKPRHYLPLRILSRCRSYLSLPTSRSILSMIKRYPAIFQLFSPPPSPTNASDPPLSVRLTPAAASLAAQESLLKSQISSALASKLHKLLMLSFHRRLLLSKLVHLAPDLGLPPNFRSRLCNEHPQRFRTVDTSYGRALELVSWDPDLAVPFPAAQSPGLDLIIDRPAKFKMLRLPKGLNLKRRHRDFLIKFGELPEMSPYSMDGVGLLPAPHTMEAEKRACAVVREMLGLTVEKRTLVDHLTHFRKEFGLSNKVRGMLVRHPEMFYVSIKGQRDSVFLVEAYDERGQLVLKEEDELLVAKERLMELVRIGKRIRRERRNRVDGVDNDEEEDDDDEEEEEEEDDNDDGFEELFEAGIEDDWEDFGVDEEEDIGDEVVPGSSGEFWTVNGLSKDVGGGGEFESW
ncbi:protein WHAT'S THIS FACTOR 1 homolog, chloroplastic [Magnolia sinica]|uniref:protein WHAT'S THIS FACTOR 1 homolog, chloroplastic n=1 Tax=Magnolia sinica TaxID=86752 RepID=UPI00265A7E81|nr:protein WHAT'S THIS FACTOR 1 homolog, chloroplastic [Magnolia sinica]